MKTSKSVIRQGVAAAGVVVVLTACTGVNAGPTTETTTPATTTPATTTPATTGTSDTSAASATTGTSATSTGSTTGQSATGSATPGSASPAGGRSSLVATADLLDPAGVEVGTVDFAVAGTVVTVTAEVAGLPPGFKGFHVHAIGKCEPNSENPTDPSKVGDFLSAGGHLGATGAAHPGHDGDLTSLQVGADGSAELVTTTEAFDVEALFDEDGSAVMVHLGPDNFGNIPTRYAPGGPDADTLATGDSGGRAACGVVEEVGA